MKKYLFLSLIFVVISSCKTKIEPFKPEYLYKKYEKSVVLIRNDYYFEVELNTGFKVYFTDFKNNELINLTLEEEEILQNVNTIYGTGFFVSKDGLIATNRHVVAPQIDASVILNTLRLHFANSIQLVETNLEVKKREITEINNFLYNYDEELSYADIDELKTKRTVLENERMVLYEIGTKLDFNQNWSEVRCISSSLSIAFNDTYATKKDDFKECVLRVKSELDDIDLAIIQLKEKITPTFVNNIFDFEDHNPNIERGTFEKGEEFDVMKKLRIDTKVYMIGFNYGPSIATTEEGLKAQLTQGTVSQESDRKRVLYSIPSLDGSSGSPIIDMWGNLIAINFAKVSGTQNFNYGILSRHLKNLIEEL
jgi:hypothetical protein